MAALVVDYPAELVVEASWAAVFLVTGFFFLWHQEVEDHAEAVVDYALLVALRQAVAYLHLAVLSPAVAVSTSLDRCISESHHCCPAALRSSVKVHLADFGLRVPKTGR